MSAQLHRPSLLSHHEGWRDFAETAPLPRPDSLSRAELARLGDAAREEHNERRRRFHASVLIRTPQVEHVHAQLWDLLDANLQGVDRVKGAAVIDAPPALGKSTTANTFGRDFHQQQIRRFGTHLDEGQALHLPVCRVGFAGRMTTRGLNEMILNFYAHPARNATPRSLRNRNIAAAAADCVTRHGTRLLIIDDIHFLKLHTNDGIAVANELKWLANEYPATFLFTGVNLQDSGLLSEGLHGRHAAMAQTARRWTLLTMHPFTLANHADDRTWKTLLATIETKLLLADARPGMLVAQADYLFERSTGMIGSLFELLMRGAARAMRTGTERLTRDLLDGIRIDQAAEERRTLTAHELSRRRNRSKAGATK